MMIARAAAGAISGLVATVPMTVVMVGLHHLLPLSERYPLPPEEITQRLLSWSGKGRKAGHEERDALTLALHFGYGAAGGGLYVLTARRAPLPAAVSGVLFALLVWAGSYLGWLPAFHILSPATKHPERRNLLMIAAHIVWGATTGMLTTRLAERAE